MGIGNYKGVLEYKEGAKHYGTEGAYKRSSLCPRKKTRQIFHTWLLDHSPRRRDTHTHTHHNMLTAHTKKNIPNISQKHIKSSQMSRQYLKNKKRLFRRSPIVNSARLQTATVRHNVPVEQQRNYGIVAVWCEIPLRTNLKWHPISPCSTLLTRATQDWSTVVH